jgi:N-acyl homoserine lactone hydrolase
MRLREVAVIITSKSPKKILNFRLVLKNATFVVAILLVILAPQMMEGRKTTSSNPDRPPAVRSTRLYVFDCGTLRVTDMSRFQLKNQDVTTMDLAVPCFLVVHPKGTLIWDTGAVPDDSWKPTGKQATQHLVLSDGQTRDVTMIKSLKEQLAEIGYSPSDITYLALSHYHYDHTGNANEFAGSTWLVRQVERDAMFAEKVPGTTQPSSYSALRGSKTIIIKTDDYDVFGDGTVVFKLAPGHTPGHQVLYLSLAKSGKILIAGDLYHYWEERALDRVPTFEYDAAQTRASRVVIEAFLKKTGAQMWIEHDLNGNSKLKKSPSYYE